MGKKYQIGSVYLFTENKDYSHRYTWTTSKWLEKSRIGVPSKEIDEADLGEPTSSLTVNANRTKILLRNTEKCSNHESPPEQLKKDLVGRNRTRIRSFGLMTWKAMRRNVWNDIANWRMKRFSNCTRSLHNVSTTITNK